MKKKNHPAATTVNYYCILMEGLFNTLGTDILGLSTIVPLFLSEFHASLTLIGSLSSAQSIIHGVTPLIAGGFVAGAPSKRKLSLLFNGISRGSILLIPLILLFHFPDSAIIGIFFAIMLSYFCMQSITGITWNHLLGDCVDGKSRGKLVGTLFSCSGLITFLSSNLVKIIRDNPDIDRWNKYGIIFGLAGILLAISTLCFIPLKEERSKIPEKQGHNVRAYLLQLFSCYKNKHFDWMLFTNCFSQSSIMINTFIYLYAQNFLKLPATKVSSLLVVQTLGVIAGGFSTGRISSRFGSRRMLVFTESLGIFVPICNLFAMRTVHPFYLMCVSVFLIGFSRSGYMGYQTHLLEIAEPDRKIYYIVTKSLSLLPISLVSTLVGHLLQQVSGQSVFAVRPIYFAQIAAGSMAVFGATKLKLIVYPKTPAKAEK